MAKRSFDVAVAALAMLLLSWLLAAVAVAVLVGQGRPVLFRQWRAGRGGRPFLIRKFCTMRPAGPGMELLDDEERTTRLGSFLRSTSLDELPELWNVLRGDMSLVGPRPLPVEYLPLYDEEQALRHEVRPGITGLAQVSGRNALSWEDRFALDGEYVKRSTLRLDLALLLRTVVLVVRRADVVPPDAVAAPLFTGSTGRSA